MRHRLIPMLITLSTLAAGPALAYEPPTHDWLSRIAAERSELNGGIVLTEIGLPSYGTAIYTNSLQQRNQTIEQMIGLGAVEEDVLPKPLAHFHDPQFNGNASLPLTVNEDGYLGATLFALPYTSADWALEEVAGNLNIGVPGWNADQDYSYREARRYFNAAMTGSSPSFRSTNAAAMFESLGHIVHHLQDMGQPQHTRNDAHLPLGTPAGLAVILGLQPYDASRYETFTGARFPNKQSLSNFLSSVTLLPFTITPPQLATARHYWHTPGAAGDVRVGMAEFTSRNFVSDGSLFEIDTWPYLSGQIRSPSQLFVPLPDGSNTNIVARQVNVTYADNTTASGTMEFIVGNVRDDYTGRTHTNRELAATSVITTMSQVVPQRRVISINREVFSGMQEILLPRAVGFSTGMINHFFRARLGLQRAPNEPNLWEVRNLSSESMSGTFLLYFESASGTRTRYGAVGATLAPGGSVNIASPNPAASTTRAIAVFEGRLGAEQNFPGGAAAARVINYTTPPIPCGTPLVAQGSSEGYQGTYELGTTVGTVPVEFEAYNIPDGLTITADNSANTSLVDTGGLISGRHTYTFNNNPASLGTTKVDVNVTGNQNPATAWWIVVGCPGDTLIDPADRPQPVRNVRWTFISDGSFGVSCNFDFHIDGLFVTRVVGNRSFFVPMTVGRHDLEYRNKTCSSGTSAAYTSTYQDPSGTYPVRSPVFGNTWIYEIH